MTSIDRIVLAADREKNHHRHDNQSARDAEIMAYLAAAREGIVMALEAIDDRSKEENFIVCPGMWFAAGYVRKMLLPGFDAVKPER